MVIPTPFESGTLRLARFVLMDFVCSNDSCIFVSVVMELIETGAIGRIDTDAPFGSKLAVDSALIDRFTSTCGAEGRYVSIHKSASNNKHPMCFALCLHNRTIAEMAKAIGRAYTHIIDKHAPITTKMCCPSLSCPHTVEIT